MTTCSRCKGSGDEPRRDVTAAFEQRACELRQAISILAHLRIDGADLTDTARHDLVRVRAGIDAVLSERTFANYDDFRLRG